MSRIRIALFSDRAAAEPIRQRLMAAGLPAELHYEPALAKLWFVSKRGGGVRLEVPLPFATRASCLLLEWDSAQEFLRDAIRCPECGSLRADYPQYTEKSLLTNLVIGLLAELRLVERKYYCEDCHFMWSKPSSKPVRLRAHTAPNYFIEGTD